MDNLNVSCVHYNYKARARLNFSGRHLSYVRYVPGNVEVYLIVPKLLLALTSVLNRQNKQELSSAQGHVL